jgi:hypothetical protein
MCNPIANKIIEREKIMELTSQQQQQQQQQQHQEAGQRIANEPDAGQSNNATADRSEQATQNPPSTDATDSVAIENSSTVAMKEDGDEEGDSKNKKKNKKPMDSIREYDVLMGRGSGPNRHSGNIHFRAIVGEVFDEFLSKHGSNRTMIVDSGTDMLRIDPSTKNRLAQAVLDKITLEKKGRFLQKLNKKELVDAIEKGEAGDLIKARAVSIMDAAMATTTVADVENDSSDEKTAAPTDSSHEKVSANAVVYYRIIPEKQILAKIKQTFRFLRDQHEASNAEKHRHRVRQIAAAVGLPRDQQPLSAANPLGGVGSMQIPGGLANASTVAAAYALMGRMGANAGVNHPLNGLNVHPNPIPDQLGSFNNANVNGRNTANTSNNANLWAAARNLNNLMAPPSTSMTMNALKAMNPTNPPGGAIDLASRLLIDLPQPKRILSTADATSAPSLLQATSLAAAANRLDASNNNNNNSKIASNLDNSTKRLLEELTLNRLANLQKQREDTINAYLAMERPSGGTQGSTGIANAVPQPSAANAQQLQRLFNLNAAAAAPTPTLPVAAPGNEAAAAALRGLTGSTSEPISLLLQLNSSQNNRNNNNVNRTPGNFPLRAYNSFT